MKLKISDYSIEVAKTLGTQINLIERVLLKHCIRSGVIGDNYNYIVVIDFIHNLFENYLPDELISQFIEDKTKPSFNGSNWNKFVNNIKNLEIE